VKDAALTTAPSNTRAMLKGERQKVALERGERAKSLRKKLPISGAGGLARGREKNSS